MEKRTEIGEIGEFGLINHIAAQLTEKQAWTELGIGDDTAVLDPKGNKVVTTTELLIEGVHFDLAYTPLQHLGFKAVSVVLSDIAAMNAIPTQVMIGLGLSNRFSVESVDALYEGIRLACEEYKVDVVGGDTTSSPQGLILSMTATGVVEDEKLVKRGTAKP
jgi:thiamine-monophosphate kinase